VFNVLIVLMFSQPGHAPGIKPDRSKLFRPVFCSGASPWLTFLANTALLSFAFLMLAAAWTDMARFTIPNWIPAVMIAVWIVSSAPSWAGLGRRGAVSCGVRRLSGVGMALWAPGWLGGGDVKLIAAGALWFGWPDALMFIVGRAASGGVLALVLVLLRRVSPALPVDAEWLGGPRSLRARRRPTPSRLRAAP
jgi:prepilin peptidase CpaA